VPSELATKTQLCEQQSLLLVHPVLGPDGEHAHLPPEHVNEVQSAP
jgi:hypothetical protein